MHRSDWELAVYVRCHIAELASERQVGPRAERRITDPASLLTHLRHRLGFGLIHLGQALVGYGAAGTPHPARHSAAWGHPGS